MRAPVYKQFESNKDSWAADIKELVEGYNVEGSTLDQILTKTKQLQPY